MNRFVIVCAAVVLVAAGCSKSKGGGQKLKSDVDSVAYIIGMNVGANLMKMDSTMNVGAVCEGIRDAFRTSTRMTAAEAETYYLRYVNYVLPEKARAFEEQFLEDIVKSNRSYARTTSGVAYTVTEVGNQELIPSSDRDSVVMRYVIRTADGQQVYSSYDRADTLRAALGDLTRGVQESLRLIGKGGKINAWMPSAAAYGAEGNKQMGVLPNATLYYEIELIGVDKYANRFRTR